MHSAAPACHVSDVSVIGDQAVGVLTARNTSVPFCEQTIPTRVHVCVVEMANVTESPRFGRPSPLLSATIATARLEMLLTLPGVGFSSPVVDVPSPCTEPELLNRAP